MKTTHNPLKTRKFTIKNIIILALIVCIVIAIAIYVSGGIGTIISFPRELVSVPDFEENQVRAKALAEQEVWYTPLVDEIKEQLPTEAAEATGHIYHLMVMEPPNATVSAFECMVPFRGYMYSEEVFAGLTRIHFIPFFGMDLHVALMEWSLGLRSEPPQMTLLDRGEISPVLVLASEDPLSQMEDSELQNRFGQLAVQFVGHFYEWFISEHLYPSRAN